MALAATAQDAHEPIRIQSDAEFQGPDILTGNGVRGGSGTADDPYVISDWRIQASTGQPAIFIHGTTVHVLIQNVTVDVAPGTEASLLFLTGGHFDVRDVRIGGAPGDVWFDEVYSARMERIIMADGDLYVRHVPSVTAIRNQLGSGTLALEPTGETTVVKNLIYGRPGASGIDIANSFTDESWFPTVLEGNQVHNAGLHGITAGSLFTGHVCDNLVLGARQGHGISILLNERAEDFRVCDNFVRDATEAALDVSRGTALRVVNNTLRESVIGFDYQDSAGIVEDNFIVANTIGVRTFSENDPSLLVFRHNILLENEQAASSAHDKGPYDLRWNYWGTETDPRATGEKDGTNQIQGAILYDPWCADPACEEVATNDPPVPSASLASALVGVTVALAVSFHVRRRK